LLLGWFSPLVVVIVMSVFWHGFRCGLWLLELCKMVRVVNDLAGVFACNSYEKAGVLAVLGAGNEGVTAVVSALRKAEEGEWRGAGYLRFALGERGGFRGGI
jgi:hypothetical protein